MSEKNPTNEIFYFQHFEKKLVYILMSLTIDKNEFFDLFNATFEITEKQMDELVELKGFEVVMVGDDKIIDEYFTDRKK